MITSKGPPTDGLVSEHQRRRPPCSTFHERRLLIGVLFVSGACTSLREGEAAGMAWLSMMSHPGRPWKHGDQVRPRPGQFRHGIEPYPVRAARRRADEECFGRRDALEPGTWDEIVRGDGSLAFRALQGMAKLAHIGASRLGMSAAMLVIACKTDRTDVAVFGMASGSSASDAGTSDSGVSGDTGPSATMETGAPDTTAVPEDGGDTGVSSGDSASGSEGDSVPGSEGDTGVVFDLGNPGDAGASGVTDGGGGKKGCEKVDFLFVVDNSGSMAPHQTNLKNNFGPFIDTITSTVAGNDFHIMVVDSDACEQNPPATSTFPPPPPHYNCNNGCDGILGAGVLRGGECMIPGGARYLTSALDSATLKSTFQCMATVGIDGSGNEMVISSLVDAIGPQSQPGQCNDGFLRRDAVLVVTVISDDHTGLPGDDNIGGVGGTPQEWFDKVIAIKGGLQNVVVLGMVTLPSDQSCIFPKGSSDKFIEFIEKFGSQGVIGSICTPNYAPYFEQAVALIDTTCDEFVPPPE